MVKRRHGAKKISRNKKSYWRKGADVSAVQSYVDSVRDDERLGVISKSDSDLYFVQKQPSVDGVDRLVKKVELRCFRNLKNNSAVKPIIKQTPSRKKTKKIQESKLKKATRNVSKFSKAKECETPEDVIYDLWNNDLKPTSTSLLQPELEDYYLRQTKQRIPKVPRSTRQMTTKLPTVEPPHPGQSYNPTFTDHQALLSAAADVELKKQYAEEKLQRKLNISGELATRGSKMAELCEGLNIVKNESPEDEDEDDYESADQSDGQLVKPILRRPISAEDRKLAIQRRKERVEKLKKLKRGEEKTKKKRLNEVFRLRTITKEIKAKEDAVAKKVQRHVALKEEKFYKPAVLGRHRYKIPDLELHLPEEVSGSLRLMKTEGNILEDRYKSLQRRNVVDTRVFHAPGKRKFRLKKYEKRDCREVTVDYVPRH